MAYRREKIARWEAGAEPELPAQLAMAALHGVDPGQVSARGWPSWLLLALPGPDARAPFRSDRLRTLPVPVPVRNYVQRGWVISPHKLRESDDAALLAGATACHHALHSGTFSR